VLGLVIAVLQAFSFLLLVVVVRHRPARPKR
jgi:hypothetical protein